MKVFQVLLVGFIFLMPIVKAEVSINPPEVLSLSAAIVDHFFFVSEEKFQLMSLEKGIWTPIDYPTLCTFLKDTAPSHIFPGGSGVNVTKGLAHFNHRCAVIGKVGSDEKGEFFLNSMKKLNIDVHMKKENLPTGQAICFITPDA